jgi:hypothetical protein
MRHYLLYYILVLVKSLWDVFPEVMLRKEILKHELIPLSSAAGSLITHFTLHTLHR